MFQLPENLTRQQLLAHISESSIYGNLCLFIGAGFSKELVGEEALSWGQLLQRATTELEIEFDFDNPNLIGTGYPEIASSICRKHSEARGLTITSSMAALKEKVAELTCWYPTDKKKIVYADHISKLSPAWVITTNYDLVIESLLPGESITIGPDQPLVFPKGRTPVYHLHGVRTYPDKIVLCREDYTALFRPNEYRQIKLALTLKESTTVLLGYGLGDDNVLTAFDWSKNVFDEVIKSYPNETIQIIRVSTPKDAPYRGHNGATILEVSGLAEFFDELMPIVVRRRQAQDELIGKLHDIRDLMVKSPQDAVIKFIDEENFRETTLSFVNNSNYSPLIDGFIPFFEKCIDKTFERSAGYGAFQGYAQGLTIVLDILDTYGDSHLPPALFHKLAHALYRQAPYIGKKSGQSHAAGKIWDSRKKGLSKTQVRELKIYAQSKGWHYVVLLLSPLLAPAETLVVPPPPPPLPAQSGPLIASASEPLVPSTPPPAPAQPASSSPQLAVASPALIVTTTQT
ncbi:SIR2 family NAD-dependent protein deacylase [Pseudomonas sp. Z4-20]|uniref:SIR2 family NAD-dependent protein deacylase n=1 Tax=Pseudomonas sp. Z4-20 TaxID=2817414 RepID=UPI003DA9E56B